MDKYTGYKYAVEKELAKKYSDNFTSILMNKFYSHVISTWDYELNPEHAALEF